MRIVVSVWSGYSTREAAEFVGISESTIRACVRDGLLSPDGSKVPARLSFRDLKVLRIVKTLGAQGVTPRRIRKQLGELQRRLSADASLAELSITAHGGNVVVRDNAGDQGRAWRADNGQMLLDFAEARPEGAVTAIPLVRRAPAPQPVSAMTADDWFEHAMSLEETNAAAAIEAYRRSLRIRPDCTETLINLGRLYAEGGAPDEAAVCFREALELDPSDATTIYNLGVVAQDRGSDGEAIELYRRALDIDPGLCEAHYNLATIFDRTGDARAAIRHINEYRKLTK